MFSITRSIRFEDVDEDAGYAYRGWNYDIDGAGALFRVRRYDDTPEMLTVISPTNARAMPGARDLVAYLLSAIGGNAVSFYDPQAGKYRAVDSYIGVCMSGAPQFNLSLDPDTLTHAGRFRR